MFQDPSSIVMTKLLVMLLDDALIEYTYNASIAGMGYYIMATMRGINVSVGYHTEWDNSVICLFFLQVKIKGFNEKQSILLNSIIKKLVNFVVDDKKFAVYKEQVSLSCIYDFDMLDSF